MSKRRNRKRLGKAKKLKNIEHSNDHHTPCSDKPIQGEIKIVGPLEIPETKLSIDQHHAEYDKPTGYKEHTKGFERATAKIAAWTLVATIAYLIATILIFIQAKRSANAATESNRINREALVTTQRAYVSLEQIESTNSTVRTGNELSNEFQLVAKNTNAGATPAINVVTYFNVLIFDKLREPREEEFFDFKSDYRKSFVGPKADLRLGPVIKTDTELFGIHAPKNRAEIKEVLPGKGVIAIGWIVYNDVFKATKAHVTEFC